MEHQHVGEARAPVYLVELEGMPSVNGLRKRLVESDDGHNELGRAGSDRFPGRAEQRSAFDDLMHCRPRQREHRAAAARRLQIVEAADGIALGSHLLAGEDYM